MKKLLLTIGVAALSLTSFAQSSFTLFDGSSSSALNGKPYSFGGATVTVDTASVIGVDFVYYHMLASDTGGYGGGVGAGRFKAGGMIEKVPFTGSVSNTTLSFKVNTNSTSPVVKFQFVTMSGKQFGYQFDFTDSLSAKTDFAEVMLPASMLKMIVADQFTTNDVADSLITSIAQLQFVFAVKGGEANVGDISFIEANPLGLSDSFTSTSSNETVSAYDMLGNLVGTGKINDLALENGRVYIIKSSSETKKIVMVK